MASDIKFLKNIKIGREGELKVFETLNGRSHWNSTKFKPNSLINPEIIVCQAQQWDDRTTEHKHNKDYEVSVNACKVCKFHDCQYKEDDRYPEAVTSKRHEVKTNIPTHNKKIKANEPALLALKELAPTGNLFIEYWQNVIPAKGQRPKYSDTYPDDRKGWFQRNLADWYHFYQPVISKDEDNITKDHPAAIRFQEEMSTSDRLLLKKEFGYIVSITGEVLKRIEAELCVKLFNRNPLMLPADNEDGTYSIGTVISIPEILNNPRYYKTNGQGPIIFTPVLELVEGTRASNQPTLTYYLPEALYKKLYIPKDKNQNDKPEIEEWESWQAIEKMNEEFVWYGEIEQSIPSKTEPGKQVMVKIVDGWAKARLNGDIEVFGTIIIDGETQPPDKSMIFRKDARWQVELKRIGAGPANDGFISNLFSSGYTIGPIGDGFVQGYMSGYAHNQKLKQRRPITTRLDLKPYVHILKLLKPWSETWLESLSRLDK